jgi:uncharacterized membrane protein YdjX (TVP38/TMEM64 family)
MKLSPRLKKLLAALLSLAIAYAVMAVAFKLIGLENAHLWIERAGPWAPLVFTIICAASLVAAPLSGSSVFIAGGALFGKEIAFVLSFIASLIGCSINYWISRRYGRRVAVRLVGKEDIDELDAFVARLKGHHSVLYMALMMLLGQDVVSYAIGLTKIDYFRFALALVPAAAVLVGFYIYVGTSLLEALIA